MEWNIISRRRRRRILEANLARLQEMAVELLDQGTSLTCVVRRDAGTSIKHTAYCTRSVRLSCGATLTLAIPAVRMQSTSTSTSSSQWQAEPTIRMSSCAFCSFMLAEHTCSTNSCTIRYYCRSWRAWRNPQQRLQESGASTDSYHQECTLLCYWNFDVACEADIRYPS